MDRPTRMLNRRDCCSALAALACAPAAASREGRAWVLGQSAPLSGPFGAMGQDSRDGALLALEDVNRRGGLHGRPLRLLSLDDAYDVPRATANARTLLSDPDVLCFFNHAGSATVLATLPLAATAGMPCVGPVTGHAALYQDRWPNLFVTRASLADEFDKIFDYVATVGYRRVGFVHYDNAVGAEQLRDVEAGLRRRGVPLHAGASMPLNGSAAAAAARMAPRTPDAVILGVSGMDAVGFIRAMAQAGPAPVHFARSLVGSNLLAAQLGPLANGVVVSQLVPSPFRPNTPLVRDYLRLLKERDPQARPSFLALEAFINARLVVLAIDRAGREVDRSRLLQSLNSLGRVDLGGYLIDFSNGRRVGSRHVELTMLRADGSFAQ